MTWVTASQAMNRLALLRNVFSGLQRSSVPPRRTTVPPPVGTMPMNPKPASAFLEPPPVQHATDRADDFNVVIFAAKALGIATVCVAAGAATAVWGVKTALGVRSVRAHV